MVGRDAIGERVRPTGIVRDVAADGASRLAARIGGVEEAVSSDGFGDVQINHAGLDDGEAVFQVNFQYAIEAGERQDDTACGRNRAAGQASAGAARYNRHIGALGGFYYG